MPTTEKKLRVLIVDDNRDGADSLGLVLEALGNQVHVTYGGAQALDVAAAFRPDLMLLDLAMPEMDGCVLVQRFHAMPAFTGTKIVAVTGHADEGHKTLALKAGFDAVLFKPVVLKEMDALLAGIVAAPAQNPRQFPAQRGTTAAPSRLPIGEARRIRSQRSSKTLTQPEAQAAICEGIGGFQTEYLGWKSDRIQAHFLKDFLVIRIFEALTVGERQLSKTSSAGTGRDLIKQVRRQLLELARPMLDSLVHEVAGVKVLSMHHDISTKTGEEVILFSLVESPLFGPA